MTDDVEESVENGEFDPKKPLKKSAPYLKLISRYNKAGFKDYSDRADNIDKKYADLERLANTARDREFSIFWANIQDARPVNLFPSTGAGCHSALPWRSKAHPARCVGAAGALLHRGVRAGGYRWRPACDPRRSVHPLPRRSVGALRGEEQG